MESKYQNVYAQIGLRILYYRKQRHMTQLELAERAHYSRNHIQNIETGKTVPSLEALLDIAEALEVSLCSIFEVIADA